MNYPRNFGPYTRGRGFRPAPLEQGRPSRLHHRRFRRRYITRDERIAHLEGYLSELRLEAQAVEERLAELRPTD
ncbi:MAG: hypothetical protein GXX93_13590 [Anaerolineae bacterium]|nr:hypothetical protein [Anaerolineae bacterium]